MHEPEPIRENVMPKILFDFDMQIDPLISARRRDLVRVDKRKKPTEQWILPSRRTTKKKKTKENQKIDRYLDLARELKISYGISEWWWY